MKYSDGILLSSTPELYLLAADVISTKTWWSGRVQLRATMVVVRMFMLRLWYSSAISVESYLQFFFYFRDRRIVGKALSEIRLTLKAQETKFYTYIFLSYRLTILCD